MSNVPSFRFPETSVDVADLNMYTIYKITVSGVTGADIGPGGEGPKSDAINVWTEEHGEMEILRLDFI